MRNPEPVTDAGSGADTGARVMLVVLCCVWGVTWPIMRIALNEVPPFTMRTFSTLAGGLALFAVCLHQRQQFAPSRRQSLDACHRLIAAQRRQLQRVLDLRPARRRDLAGGDPRLHHADLGGGPGVALPRREADRHAADRHRAVRRRPRRADLSADSGGNSVRNSIGARHRGELGGRHGLSEVGADRTPIRWRLRSGRS